MVYMSYGPPSPEPNAKPFADNRSHDATIDTNASNNFIFVNFRLIHLDIFNISFQILIFKTQEKKKERIASFNKLINLRTSFSTCKC